MQGKKRLDMSRQGMERQGLGLGLGLSHGLGLGLGHAIGLGIEHDLYHDLDLDHDL
jgi:hypothetical protein